MYFVQKWRILVRFWSDFEFCLLGGGSLIYLILALNYFEVCFFLLLSIDPSCLRGHEHLVY